MPATTTAPRVSAQAAAVTAFVPEHERSADDLAAARHSFFLYLAHGGTTMHLMGYVGLEVLELRASPQIYAAAGPADDFEPEPIRISHPL